MPKSAQRSGRSVHKVLIYSGNALMRKGLMAICREEFGLTPHAVEVGSGINGISNQALVRILRGGRGLAVLELPVERMDFLLLIAGSRKHFPNVLVIGDFAVEEFAFRAMKNGALGYLRKSTDEETLRVAMRHVAAGSRYLAPGLAEKWAERLMGSAPVSPVDALSDREYQVFRMLREGDSVGRIAASLGLAAKTVYAHRERVRKKLGQNLRPSAWCPV